MGHSEGMAGAGQPWYMPAIWPIGNITATLLKPPDDKPVQPKAKPFIIFDPFDMVLACVAGLRNFCLAYVVIFMLYDDANPYPAFGAANCGTQYFGDVGYLWLLGLVFVFFATSGQTTQVQNNATVPINTSDAPRRRRHLICLIHRLLG